MPAHPSKWRAFGAPISTTYRLPEEIKGLVAAVAKQQKITETDVIIEALLDKHAPGWREQKITH